MWTLLFFCLRKLIKHTWHCILSAKYGLPVFGWGKFSHSKTNSAALSECFSLLEGRHKMSWVATDNQNKCSRLHTENYGLFGDLVRDHFQGGLSTLQDVTLHCSKQLSHCEGTPLYLCSRSL